MVENVSERRRFPRYEAAWPIEILDASGRLLAETQTVDLSKGGAFFLIPPECVPEPEGLIEFRLSVPATDGGVEQFSGRATVVRHQEQDDADQVGVAIKFASPLPFDLAGLAAAVQQGT